MDVAEGRITTGALTRSAVAGGCAGVGSVGAPAPPFTSSVSSWGSPHLGALVLPCVLSGGLAELCAPAEEQLQIE